MKIAAQLSLVFVFGSFLCGCAPMGASHAAQSARVDALMAQVRVGESRKEVERTLGRPYSVQSEGHETVLTYVTGPEEAEAEAESAQRAQANMSAFSSVLGALGQFGGNSLGSAGSIGSQVIGAGSSISGSGYSHHGAEQTTVKVRLRGNKVVSVDREDSGRVGIGSEY